MAVEEGMKRVFFSQSLPQALTRDSQPGWLAGSQEGPRLRGGKPHGAQLQQTRLRRPRRGARRLRAAAPGAAAAAAPGEAASAVSPDEQVPLTLRLSTRTRTRKTGRAPARGGAERGWAGGAQLPLVLLLLLLLLLRLLPRPPPPMGSACSGAARGMLIKRLGGSEQLAAHLKLVVACHFLVYSSIFHLSVVTWGEIPSLSLPKFHY